MAMHYGSRVLSAIPIFVGNEIGNQRECSMSRD
jgi:hypothetical protein